MYTVFEILWIVCWKSLIFPTRVFDAFAGIDPIGILLIGTRMRSIYVSEKINMFIFKSTPPSQPNKVGLKCPSVHPYLRSSVRPSTKSFFDFNEIWYLGRGRRVMHDGMQYEPIQGHGQGQEPL